MKTPAEILIAAENGALAAIKQGKDTVHAPTEDLDRLLQSIRDVVKGAGRVRNAEAAYDECGTTATFAERTCAHNVLRAALTAFGELT